MSRPAGDNLTARRARRLGITAGIAGVGTLIYLPAGVVAFGLIAFLAWRWHLPTWMKVAYTAIAILLLLLVSFALPRTFEVGEVTITH